MLTRPRVDHRPSPASITFESAVTRATIRQLPARCDLRLFQGDSFTLTVEVFDLTGEAFDLTGATARSQIRVVPTDDEVVATFAAAVHLPNTIVLDLAPEDSARVPERAVWDVEITQAGTVTTLAAGAVTMQREVTR